MVYVSSLRMPKLVSSKISDSYYFRLYFKVRTVLSISNKLKLQIALNQINRSFINTDCCQPMLN